MSVSIIAFGVIFALGYLAGAMSVTVALVWMWHKDQRRKEQSVPAPLARDMN